MHVQRRLRNVQKSMMHMQSCCFVNINLLLFNCSWCGCRRCCLSSLLLLYRNFATMVTWHHTAPFHRRVVLNSSPLPFPPPTILSPTLFPQTIYILICMNSRWQPHQISYQSWHFIFWQTLWLCFREREIQMTIHFWECLSLFSMP